jgi:hypothetical protein
MDQATEQKYRDEAERLAALPREEQQKILAVYRQCAENPKTPKKEREWGQARVAALQRHLRRLNRGSNLKNST